MAEFTGERVIPGQVPADLWNEHTSRYAFAARFANGRRVLDAGCGSGYGAARLAMKAAVVVGLDISKEAIDHARAQYAMANLHFLQASCIGPPFPDGAFDLVVAFEVIEHLAQWREFLQTMRRITAQGGLFIVSTPNKAYYGASRGTAEANPFHVHEFDYDEFRQELQAVYPEVRIALQNHVGGIAFQPVEQSAGVTAWLETGAGAPTEAHFFIGVCSDSTSVEIPAFVYIPRAANVLREREQHIERLELELQEKNNLLQETLLDRQKLVEMFRQQNQELENRNRWARELNTQLVAARQRIADLQKELAEEQEAGRQVAAGYEAQIREVEKERQRHAEWAQETEKRLTGELEARAKELVEAVRLLDRAEATVEERTRWAQRLEAELRQAEALLSMARASRWLKLGRAFGVGPVLGDG